MRCFGGKKRSFINVSVVVLISAMLLCSCNKKEKEADEKAKEQQELAEYIEQRYGVASNPVYGRRTAFIERQPGQKTTTFKEKIKKVSKGGAVLYKKMNLEGQSDGLLSIYVAECGDNGIFLYADYVYASDGTSTNTDTVILSDIETNKRCYAVAEGKYLTGVAITEEKDDVSDRLKYNEKISVYKFTDNGLDNLYTINRKLESGNTSEQKEFKIESKTGVTVYASGYDSYYYEGAEYISTEEEFCAKANQLLKDSSMNCIKLNKTSWNSRWFGMSIDESGMNENMVKLDYSYSEPAVNENGDEVTDITIEINSGLSGNK